MKKILLLAAIFSQQAFADVHYLGCSYSDGSSQSVWVQDGYVGQFGDDCIATGGLPFFHQFESIIIY